MQYHAANVLATHRQHAATRVPKQFNLHQIPYANSTIPTEVIMRLIDTVEAWSIMQEYALLWNTFSFVPIENGNETLCTLTRARVKPRTPFTYWKREHISVSTRDLASTELATWFKLFPTGSTHPILRGENIKATWAYITNLVRIRSVKNFTIKHVSFNCQTLKECFEPRVLLRITGGRGWSQLEAVSTSGRRESGTRHHCLFLVTNWSTSD